MDSKQMCPEEFHTFISSATPYLLEVEGVKSLIGQAAKDEPRHNLNKLCLGGHIGVHFICAHQFLVKANDDRRYLQAWMEHMKAAQLRRRMNNELNFPPNFEGLVLRCIDADF